MKVSFGLSWKPQRITYLANVQAIDSTGKGVKVQNDVHAIPLDGVVCDLLKIPGLVARVVSGSWELDPRGVRSWDA